MYERPETRASHDRLRDLLKEAMQRRGIPAPGRLSRPSDHLLHHWRRPELLFSQTCGHLFRTGLCDLVHLVGTPDYGFAGCPPGHYRSILIRRASDGRTRLADFDGATLAYNDPLSQSGHIAPTYHARREGIRLDPAVRTGSHRLSVQAVAEGRADVAAIDASAADSSEKPPENYPKVVSYRLKDVMQSRWSLDKSGWRFQPLVAPRAGSATAA